MHHDAGMIDLFGKVVSGREILCHLRHTTRLVFSAESATIAQPA
jgi:hypothetical protein